jgi:hypothetical protein
MESNVHGLTNQSSLILGQAALELLSWIYFVEDQKQFTAKQFDQLSAADRIRNLLTAAKVRTGVPRHLGSLVSSGSSLAPSGSWADGPMQLLSFETPSYILKGCQVFSPYLVGQPYRHGNSRFGIWNVLFYGC